ncbi:hypothetical protein [Paenibacillus periandrae]|uniref:hypothetical protein n=1 Tax=Paenibacillus periandrae TaxID=1761741 RepID=UPI001F09A5EE|nr:hypothetical protein [Paenibacillus periandrae]
MDEFATMSFCGLEVFDFDTVDGIEGHFQYNNAKFHLQSLKEFDSACVEVYEDWKVIIWGDEGVIQKEFYIMDIEEFRINLYTKYPLKG